MLTAKCTESLLPAEQMATEGRNDGKKGETEAGPCADPVRAQRSRNTKHSSSSSSTAGPGEHRIRIKV